MSYETKTVELTDLKVGVGGSGSLSGYASVFNKLDSYGDTIKPGAYADTLKTFLKEGFIGWSHDALGLPVGYPVHAKEDKHGLFIEAAFHSTPEAQLARVTAAERIAAGKTMGLSIGFIPEEFDFTEGGSVRELKKIRLIETSLVLVPAERHAMVVDIKADAVAEKAEWTAAYVNDLPDSAFACILSGGEKDEDGKTTPRSLRKLPHHTAEGSVDMPHLRNAMSREPQTDMPPAMHSKAKSHLQGHMGGKADHEPIEADDLLDIDVPFPELLLQLKGWLIYGADEAEALQRRRAADQRKLAPAHAAAIADLLSTAEAVTGRLERLIAEPDNVRNAGLKFALELRRRKLAAFGETDQ